MLPRHRALMVLILGLSSLLLLPRTAHAGYHSVLRSQIDLNSTNGSALVVAMPYSDNGRIVVTRIRLSTSKGTSVDYRFRSARESLSLGATKAFAWSCSMPGCAEVYSLNGVVAGAVYDMDGLELALAPGHRLFLYATAAVSSDFFTIEVWWNDL